MEWADVSTTQRFVKWLDGRHTDPKFQSEPAVKILMLKWRRSSALYSTVCMPATAGTEWKGELSTMRFIIKTETTMQWMGYQKVHQKHERWIQYVVYEWERHRRWAITENEEDYISTTTTNATSWPWLSTNMPSSLWRTANNSYSDGSAYGIDIIQAHDKIENYYEWETQGKGWQQ